MSEEARHSSESGLVSALLSQFSPRASVFFAGESCATQDCDSGDEGHLHLLRSGAIEIAPARGPAQLVTQPSLVLLTGDTAHRMTVIGDEPAELICARVQFGDPDADPLMLGFPDLTIVQLDQMAGLEATLELLFAEAFAQRFGHDAAVNRLVELLIIMLLRHMLASGKVNTGLLGGLAEGKISRSLQAMHRDPARPWSVESLAETAGMSRANFAAAFKLHVGLSPGDYLTGLRVAVAKKAMLSGEQLKSAAARAGYRSTTAFARVFQRRVGCSPRDFMRTSCSSGALRPVAGE